MSDRIVVVNHGLIEQNGTREEVYCTHRLRYSSRASSGNPIQAASGRKLQK
jgi:ABC-type Fe3+/spermidine/putrescine transport system ATPase subunit